MTEDMTRTDWTREEIAALFDLPFDELMWEAQGVHRRHHARGEVQLCTLLSPCRIAAIPNPSPAPPTAAPRGRPSAWSP